MIHRRPLPNRRTHISQKVQIAGEPTLYLSVHDDRQSPEVFLRVKGLDCFSELIGLDHVIARLMSLAVQYGPGLRRSAISLLELKLPHIAPLSGTLASNTVRVCRI
jgi:hypothetical protein